MNLGIQETEHFEGVYPVIRLFDNGINRIFLFVNRETSVRLHHLLGTEAEKYHWVVQDEGESTFSFCIRISNTIRDNKIKLLYLNTISKHHIAYALLLYRFPGLKSILTVHDVNCLLKDKPSLAPRKFLKWLGKKLLAAKVTAFNTVSETVQPYLFNTAGRKKKVFTVPGSVYEKAASPRVLQRNIKLVIPGTIDQRRRDYEQVFRLLRITEDISLSITLLGGGKGSYADMIRDNCLNVSGGRVKCFNEQTVDQSVFDQEMDEAHLIWIPSVIHTQICGGIPETYGITKSSGNIFDIIKHARPFLYPATLAISDHLKMAGVAYHDVNDIANFLRKILSVPEEYQKLADAAELASRHFTITTLRQRMHPLFEGIIDSF